MSAAPARPRRARRRAPHRAPRRTRRAGGVLRAFATALIATGALLLADAALTLVWQEPLSSIYAHVEQGRLRDRLDRLEHFTVTPVERRALARLPDARRRLAFAARSLARRTHEGDPLGRLRIARMDLSVVVVEGTAAGDLRDGPGHYPATPLPGQPGTVAVAGHRTTYGAWFRRLDRLRPGDPIRLDMPYGGFDYRVERTRVVAPTALWVTRRVAYDRLVLSACQPLYSAAQRIVVFARLVAGRPGGAAA